MSKKRNQKSEKECDSKKEGSDISILNSDGKADELKKLVEEKYEAREYSIFNYLKATPSVLIALLSACVAIATFVSKVAAANGMKSILSFWNFNLSYLNYSDSSLLFSTLMSFLCSILIIISILWNESCQKSLILRKRYLYENKMLIKRLESEKKNVNNEERKELDLIIQDGKSVVKEKASDYRIMWIISMFVTCVTASFAIFLAEHNEDYEEQSDENKFDLKI